MKKLILFPLIILFLLFCLFSATKMVQAAEISLVWNSPVTYGAGGAVYKKGDTITFSGSVSATSCGNSNFDITLSPYIETITNGVKHITPLATITLTMSANNTQYGFSSSYTLPNNTYIGSNVIMLAYYSELWFGHPSAKEIFYRNIRVSTLPTAPTVIISPASGSTCTMDNLTCVVNTPSKTEDAYSFCADPNNCPPYSPGTIAVNSSDKTKVIGSGTTFTTAFSVGDSIVANSEGRIISAIASNTSMTTDTWTNTFTNKTYYKSIPGILYTYRWYKKGSTFTETYPVGDYPIGIAIDASGNVWTANGNSDNVTKLSSSGSILGTYPVPGSSTILSAIAIDASGNVWVTDYNGWVRKLSPSGSALDVFSAGENPAAIAADASGNIWVVDYYGTVYKFSSSSGRLGTYHVGGNNTAIAADASGNVWVTDYNEVIKLSSSGSVLGTYAAGKWNNEIAIDASGNVWVTNNDGTVTKLNSSGSVLGTYNSGADNRAIATDASGNAWVVNSIYDTVTKINPSGSTSLSYVLQNNLTKTDTTDSTYTISKSNLSSGDKWKCEVTPKNRTGFTGPAVTSQEVTIP